MAKYSVLDKLYRKKVTTKEIATFNFDSMRGPGVYNFLTEHDIQSLYNIATSKRYSANLQMKYKQMNRILNPRGFTVFHRGTNRVAYKYMEDRNILLKAGVDKAGTRDAMREFQNQQILKPFVTKIFDAHPLGISICERVVPITSYSEFAQMAKQYYDLMTKFFIGRYIMKDVGEQYFMNWGIRLGFGLVLLDYPYLYELDDSKLICRAKDLINPNIPCCGEIDYDLGFNNLVCTKCGMKYNAEDLARLVKTNKISKFKEDSSMEPIKVFVVRGDEVLFEGGQVATDTILPKTRFIKHEEEEQHEIPKMEVSVTRGDQEVDMHEEHKHTHELDPYNETIMEVAKLISEGKSDAEVAEAVISKFRASGMPVDVEAKVKHALGLGPVATKIPRNLVTIGNEEETPSNKLDELFEGKEKYYDMEEIPVTTVTNFAPVTSCVVCDEEDVPQGIPDQYFPEIPMNVEVNVEQVENDQVEDINETENVLDHVTDDLEKEAAIELGFAPAVEVLKEETTEEKETGFVDRQSFENYFSKELEKYFEEYYLPTEAHKGGVSKFKKDIVDNFDVIMKETRTSYKALGITKETVDDYINKFADDFISSHDISSRIYGNEVEEEPQTDRGFKRRGKKRKYNGMEEF